MPPIDMIMGEEHEQYFTGCFTADFPMVLNYSCFDEFSQRFYPWHWHREIELFYVDMGRIRYCHSDGDSVFQTGEGGMINSNALHSLASVGDVHTDRAITFILDAGIMAGAAGSAIDVRYVQPLLQSKNLPFFRFSADDLRIGKMRRMRKLLEQEPYGYETELRSLVTEVWMQTVLEHLEHLEDDGGEREEAQERMKEMIRFVQSRYAEKLTVRQIAQAANISERECQRCFQRSMGCTPVEYLTSVRVQQAALRLVQTQQSILDIALSCGFGSASYFGKKFCAMMHCTPRDYRIRYWKRDELRKR